MNNKVIQGSGGGGKGGGGSSGYVPVESPDNLHSRQYAKVVDLISEGEIDGLVNGLASVYLDDTPIQNLDGSYNFSGVILDTRNGTQSQTYIKGFGEVEAEVAVSTEIKYNTPVVRTISNPNLNAIKTTISIPYLTYQNPSTGDLTGTSVQIAIDINTNGAGWIPAKLSTTSYELSKTSTTATSGSTDIMGASIGIGWTGSNEYDYQTCGWLLEYRLIGASTWTTWTSGTFAGSSTIAFQDFDTWITWTSGVFTGSSTGIYVAPSDTAIRSIDLSLNKYEFKITKTSGIGSIYITSAVGLVWTNIDTISGKTTSKYQRNYRIPLSGTGPWDIRVSRLTADSTQSNIKNQTFWESYTEIIDTKLSYPNSALVALSVNAEQFNNIPRRGYEIKGLKVKVPTNYNPLTREYTGVWDGTFKVAWTDNPAWCFYDIVTNDRYGLGNYIDDTQVDKWSLYTISQYCDELVDDGFGGKEPRFTCNLFLQTREEAYSVINSMASIFRGMVYWSDGAIVPVHDAPTSPTSLFNQANVVNGEFYYEGSSAKARHTVALVSWNDPKDNYTQKIEYVEDTLGISKYGVVETQVVAVGCTSRGQAHRLGRWLLYTERMESETIRFKTGIEGLTAAPGTIIKVIDPIRSGTRTGGRLVSATTTSVVLDSTVTIELNNIYTLWLILEDGSIVQSQITNSIGTHSELQLFQALPSAPLINSIWILGSSTLVPETWRVLSVVEIDNSLAEITALAYSETKFIEVEQDILLERPATSILSNNIPDPVSDVTLIESLYLVGIGVIGIKASLSWKASASASYYLIRYNRLNENIQELTTRNPSIDVLNLSEGIYTFSISAINVLGKSSTPTIITKEIYGKLIPPTDVSNFNLAVVNGSAYLTWDPPTDLDVIVGGYMRIRYSPPGVQPNWNNSIDISTNIPATTSSILLPLLDGTYYAKWVDSTGNASTNPVYISSNVVNITGLNIVETINEHPAFAGTKVGMIYDSTLGGLKLDGLETIDSITTLMDSWGYIDAPTGTAAAGSYSFSNSIDLGIPYISRVTASIKIELFDSADFIDGKTTNIDTWTSIDGNTIDDINSTLMIRTTLDDPNNNPTWSNWQPFFVGDWYARGYEFRVDVINSSLYHNLVIKELTVVIDMPDRHEYGNDITSGVTQYTVLFNKPFKVTPNISITTQNMYTGDYYTITNKTSSGFNIIFKDSTDTNISRTFDWNARGY